MKRTLIIIILILVALLVAGTIKYNRLNQDAETKDSIIKEQNSSIEKIELKNGLLAFEKTRAEGDLKSLLNGYHWLEDSLKVLGIKNNDLKSALFISQHTNGSGEGRIDSVLITESDTVYRVGRISIEEPYFSLSANFLPENRYKYSYMISDSLNILKTSHRKNIFSKYEHTVRVVNSNPKTVISGLTSLTIEEIPYQWAVSITVGYGITNSGLSPFIGLGVTKPILKFK